MSELHRPEKEQNPQIQEAIRSSLLLVMADLLEHFFDPAQMKLVEKYMNQAEELVKDGNKRVSFARISLDNLAKGFTASRCEAASVRLLAALKANHPQLFDRFTLITSFSSDTNGDFLSNPYWVYHSSALFRDNEGTWYAFSPANFKNFDDVVHAMDTLLSANTPEALLQDIEQTQGGNWHSDDPQWAQHLQQDASSKNIETFIVNTDGTLEQDDARAKPALKKFDEKMKNWKNPNLSVLARLAKRLKNGS